MKRVWNIGLLNKDKHLSFEHKAKISKGIKKLISKGKFKITNKGEKLSLQHKQKISKALKGRSVWNQGKPLSSKHIESIRNAMRKLWEKRKKLVSS